MRILMTVGAPGSGKTTWANTLDRKEWLVLCLDDFRDALFGGKAFFWNEVVPIHGMEVRRYVRKVYHYALREALHQNRFNIALVNTNVDWETGAGPDFAAMGHVHSERVELIVFETSAKTLWERNRQRGPAEKLHDRDLARYIIDFNRPDAWFRKKHRWKTHTYTSESENADG